MDATSIQEKKHKVCLEYHIKNCLGPCEAHQTIEAYQEDIEQAVHILKGNLSIPKSYFKNAMQEAAGNLDFEGAQHYKDKLDRLQKYQAKSLITKSSIADVDCFTIHSDEGYAYINFLKIINGAISQTQSIEIKRS